MNKTYFKKPNPALCVLDRIQTRNPNSAMSVSAVSRQSNKQTTEAAAEMSDRAHSTSSTPPSSSEHPHHGDGEWIDMAGAHEDPEEARAMFCALDSFE